MGKGSKETATTTVGRDDAAQIRQLREQGTQTAEAAMAGQTAPVNPLTYGSIGMLNNLYNQYGAAGQMLAGGGLGAMGFGSQTGLGGLGAYMNPMIGAQLAGLQPMYQQQLAQAGTLAQQQATQAGAYGGSRSAVLQGQMQGDIMRNQAAQYGDIFGNAASQGMNAMLQERARMGQLGQGMLGLGFNAFGQQQGLAGNLGQYGDYLRNIYQQGLDQNYLNNVRAQQAIGGAYGKDIMQKTTTEKSGNLFNDLLGAGMLAASIFVPGAQAAAPMITSKMAQAGNPTNVAPPTLTGLQSFGYQPTLQPPPGYQPMPGGG